MSAIPRLVSADGGVRKNLDDRQQDTEEGHAGMLARHIAIGFGVAIVFPLLVYYGVSTFSHAPKWEDFHEQYVYKPNPTPEEQVARQEKQRADNAAYKEANRVFSLRLLCAAAPLGYLAIIIGSMRAASGLHVGLIFGGIFTVTIGYWFHWSFVEDWLRFISLIVAMAVLVFISYWRFGRVGTGGVRSA